MIGSEWVGFGHFVPPNIVKNSEIENRLGLDEGFIEKRSGIKERRYVTEDMALSDLAIKAGLMAIKDSGIAAEEFGMLLLATSTPDHLLPPTAPLVAHQLGMSNAGGIDLAGACSGFLYAANLADGFVRSQNKPVLVIAANILSKRINDDEVASAILFADGAGAVVIAPKENADSAIKSSHFFSDGSQYDLIQINSGGSRAPFSDETELVDTKMSMRDGQKVFQSAIEVMSDLSQKCLNDTGISASSIDHYIPHQANIRIMDRVAQNLQIDPSKLVVSLDLYGNSSAATIALSLSLLKEKDGLKQGQNILLSAIGAGFIGAAMLVTI